MIKWIKKYPMAAAAILIVLLGLWFAAYQLRQKNIANATETKLTDDKRQSGAVQSDFYCEQLTKKEKKVFDQMQGRLDRLEGGVVEFLEPLSGKEYLRITTALENEGYNYFYGFYDIPMTSENVYVKYKSKDLLTVHTNIISKGILFLSCAEGINEAGQYAEDGTVTNLAQIEKVLSVNDEEKAAAIRKTEEETEEVLLQIGKELPGEYGEKRAVDFFLNWMSENMTVSTDIGEAALSFTSMEEVFEGAYSYNSLSAITKRQATPLGYAKILSELCRRAGMESHIVLGKWGRNTMFAEGYVLCEIVMNGQNIYVDASGGKASDLAGHKYMTEPEAKNHMSFVDYFDYD